MSKIMLCVKTRTRCCRVVHLEQKRRGTNTNNEVRVKTDEAAQNDLLHIVMEEYDTIHMGYNFIIVGCRYRTHGEVMIEL